ncbi:MAG: histidine kinase [Chitinophagaceae bacterium]
MCSFLHSGQSKTSVLLLCIQLFLSINSFAQKEKIDSLQKVLPSLQDTARVDCLLAISVQYLFKPDNDSALYYANLAYNESKKINYIHGIAESFCPKAAVQNRLYNNYPKMEQLARESLKWFDLTRNKKGIEVPYWQVGRALFDQGNYDEAFTNLKLSYELALEAGNIHFSNTVLETMTDFHRARGEYDKLLGVQQKIIDSERKHDDTQVYTIHELWVMGLTYMLLEDYPTALFYWRKLFLESDLGFISTWNQMEYAELLTLSDQLDSALYYYNKFDSAKAGVKDMRYFLVSKGEYYLAKKEYFKALPYFQKGLIYHRQLNDFNQTKRTLLDIAKCYAAIKNNDSAIKYAREGLAMALKTNSKPYIRNGYEILYSIYNRLHLTDSAYHYYQNYIALKEAVMNDQTRGKLAAYRFEHKITLLNKEKEIQQVKLVKESFFRKILIAGILGLLLLGFIIFRYNVLKRRNEKQRMEYKLEVQKLENEKTKAEFQKQTAELEMQALRAQMNPHFIFNSLNSINRFILQNNKAQASEYLTKFSRLVRLILQNSQASLISLESELEALDLYLDLEALRFNNHFDYKIFVSKDIDIDVLKVPPLIIQPYAENAIWHGMMHKEEKGNLEIAVIQENNYLLFKITDDGIGRKQAAVFASKSATRHKSMGLKITADRIAILQRSNGNELPVTINDLVNADGSAAGTEVILKIPVLYD